ncbi:MAG: terminase small subunit [Leptospira sp.]|nr:terminase small subunit [Leptospira sp.]
MKKSSKTKINDKQKLFIQSFITDFNASRAYREVYGVKNERTAVAASSRLLTNVDIVQYKNELLKQILDSKIEDLRYRIQNELVVRSFIRVNDVMNKEGEFDLEKIKNLPLGMVKKITIIKEFTKDGSPIMNHHLELGDNHKPLELLGKTVGSFDKINQSDVLQFLKDIDLTKLSEDQLLRISNGENPLEVLFGHYRRITA